MEGQPGDNGAQGVQGLTRECPEFNPFFVDITGDTLMVYNHDTPLYDRHIASPLGEFTEDDRQTNRCFNCGSPDHIVGTCPEPFNRPLVTLSRAMYEFFRNPRNSDPERLHEYEERKARRLEFCESFAVGYIRGELLRDALGLSSSPDDKDGDLPWYWNMLDWGYPPGWCSSEDPISKVLSRIEGKGEWDSEATIIYDENGDITRSPSPQNIDTEETSDNLDSEPEDHGPPKRWAKYPTDLFSSDLLPIYSGRQLPSIGMPDPDTQPTNEIPKIPQAAPVPPPWRRPGAFDAFGPPGWLAFVNSDQSSNNSTTSGQISHIRETQADDESESDMDMSE